MKLVIKDIKIGDLNSYIHSEEYTNSSFVPISKIRAISQIHNPRSVPEDICLFLAYDGLKLIGYLGALPDFMFIEENREKVYWLSCMWVLPEYRRHGVALDLLKNAYDTFKGKVLITNYIPQSKKAFEKTGQYTDLKQLEGIRGYLRFDLAQIIIRKKPQLKMLSPLLRAADFSFNLIINSRLFFKQKGLSTFCTYTPVNAVDKQLESFIREKVKTTLFRRDSEIFQWIMKYPWVMQTNQLSAESLKYYFSQESKDFRQWFIKVEANNAIVGFLILSKNKGELRTHYLIYEHEYAGDIVAYILKLSIKEGVKTYIGYQSETNSIMVKTRLFLKTKQSDYGFLIGQKIYPKLNPSVHLYEGDGDGVFV